MLRPDWEHTDTNLRCNVMIYSRIVLVTMSTVEPSAKRFISCFPGHTEEVVSHRKVDDH